jgi:hypothetical protein
LCRNPAAAITSIWQERSVVNASQKTTNHRAWFALAIAILTIQLVTALLIAPAFADAPPQEFAGSSAATRIGDQPIQLAQADLPSGIGSLNDYMHQSGDGPPTAPSSPAYSPPGYSPQSMPPRSYAPEPSLAQHWNNTDPNTRRDLLIGAAVVGAVALGMWAYQQHELYQARRARQRFYGRRPAY